MKAAESVPIAVDRLRGKRALVTGAGRRLGRAAALGLAAAGVDVAVHYRRSAEEAREVAAAVEGCGVRAALLQADLEHPENGTELLARAAEALGPIDILVNNAAIFPAGRLAEMTVADVERNVRVNALAPLFLGRALAAQEREGAIVNLLDARMVDYDALHVAYHLSKRMLFSLTRGMALEFAPRVRVNAIAPGLILPPEGEDESWLERLAHSNPLATHGGAGDIVEALLFLLRGRFITGQVIFVDGGRHMRGAMYG
ncbi:MAG: SDR family oxidoreductase [Candidatus Eisenbacteria bacterium]